MPHLAVLLLVATGIASTAGAQANPTVRSSLPALPVREDSLTVRIDGAVIGRAITSWRRVGLEQLQVYTWLGAADGDAVTDSLFSDPNTLLPIRETRVVGDTNFLVHFGRDTLFVSRRFGERTSTSHTLAPQPELYSSASLSMLAATMPFQVGASKSALLYYAPPATRGTQWVVLLVRSRVTVNGRNAWRVVANSRSDSTAFWVDAASRQILQMDVFEGPTRVTFRR